MALSNFPRQKVARRCSYTGLGLLLACSFFALSVRAAERDFLIRWIPPADGDLAGYRVYFGAAPMDYDPPQRIDEIGVAPTDPNGVCDGLLTGIDDSRDYWVVMTAVDEAGNESLFSNEILIAALPPSSPPTCGYDTDCADDGDVCNGVPVCMGGVCQAGPPLECPSTDCALGVCDPLSGCRLLPVADGTSCDDGDAATPFDRCLAGICGGVECVEDPDCDDANPCNGTESCVDFSCVAANPIVCSGATACIDAFCDPLVGGCVLDPVPDGAVCEDGDPATSADQCVAGVCTGTVPPEPELPPECDDVFGSPHSVTLARGADPATTMTVSWSAPANPDGAILRLRRHRTRSWIKHDPVVLSVSGCEARYIVYLVGLEDRTRYEYQVSGAGRRNPIWSKRKGFWTGRRPGGGWY
jgi:hypothetical protein